MVDGILELVGRDGDALHETDHIRELEVDKPDVFVADPLQDALPQGGAVGGGFGCHHYRSPSSVERLQRDEQATCLERNLKGQAGLRILEIDRADLLDPPDPVEQ